MLALLRGQTPAANARDALVHHSANGDFSIREGKWKLLLCPGSGGWSPPTRSPSPWTQAKADDFTGLPPYQLYVLTTDPAEKNNVAAVHSDVVQRLGKRMRQLIERGRTTAGAPQPYDTTTPWPHIAWFKDFR